MTERLCIYCIESGNMRWTPVPLNEFENIISRKISSTHSDCYQYCLRKNICYNLQYLELLNKMFTELDLTSVLNIQNYKIFVIISTSIIEGILFHEIKVNQLENKNLWNQISTFVAEKIINGNKMRTETSLLEERDQPIDADMTLDQMISKAESKHLLGDDHDVYASISTLRKLRNKIHLHLAIDRLSTDYNSFNQEKLIIAKTTLQKILKGYFKLQEAEIDKYFYWLKTAEELQIKQTIGYEL